MGCCTEGLSCPPRLRGIGLLTTWKLASLSTCDTKRQREECHMPQSFYNLISDATFIMTTVFYSLEVKSIDPTYAQMKGSHKDVNSRDRESLEEILELASYIIILMIKTLCFLLYLSSSPQDWTMTTSRQDYVFLYSFSHFWHLPGAQAVRNEWPDTSLPLTSSPRTRSAWGWMACLPSHCLLDDKCLSLE